MRFSILMCSRSRPSILETNVTNILSLADDPENVEILIGADDDDEATLHKVKELQETYSQVKLTILPRFKNLHKFYNLLASKAIGKYVWGMNDDSLCEISSWDTDFEKQIENTLLSYNDRIGYFAIASNSADRTSSSYGEFPIVTSQALHTLGFMDCEDVIAWGCDQIMYNIYNSVGRAFQLKVDRPMRHLYHESHSALNENRDFMVQQFKNEYSQDWSEAVKKMTEHVKSIDISSYSKRLQDKIDAK